jgi:phosphatidate cytidylyltransferase
LVFAATLWGRVAFLLLVDIILVVMLWELYGLAEKKGFWPSRSLGIPAVLAVSWELYFYQGRWLKELLLLVFTIILVVELFKGKKNPLANTAVGIFGVMYVSLFSSLLLIREIPVHTGIDYRTGGWLVILIFSTIWLCDTAAYLYGAKFGKHPLFKRVSPKKTWEGTIAGFCVGIMSAVGLHYIFVPSLSVFDGAMIGVIVGVMGQISDLIESLFKRDANVKDSSNILPGHGGFLDRFDSPLLIGPFVYVYLILFGF